MFMSLPLLRHLRGLQAESCANESVFLDEQGWISIHLESLLYVFLHVATGGKLIGSPYNNLQQEAYSTKFTTMVDDVSFERDLLKKIEDPLLRDAALDLKNLFVVDGRRSVRENVTVDSFVTILKQLLE
jgi:hypothetical protein